MADQTNVLGQTYDDNNTDDPTVNQNASDPLLGESDQPTGALTKIGSQVDKQNVAGSARQAVDDMRTQYSQDAGVAADAYKQQKAALQAATQRILGMQAGPSAKEAAYRVAAAAGTGDSAGRFNPGGVNAANADILQQQREGEYGKQQLLAQYGMQGAQSQLGMANSNMARDIQLLRVNQSAANQANSKADVPEKLQNKYYIPNPMTGQLEFHPEIAQQQIQVADQQKKDALAMKAAQDQAASGSLNPATLDYLATKFNATGIMPTGFARNGVAIPKAIATRAAELAAQNGDLPAAAIAKQAIFKANTANLTSLTKQYGSVKGFENTMMGVAQQAKQISSVVPRGDSTMLNNIFQVGARKFTDHGPLAQFDLANNTLASEYAKIMSGSMGNTAVAEGMQRDAMSRLSTAMSQGTYNAVVDQMIREAQIRNKGLSDNIDGVKGELGLGAPPPAAPLVHPGQTAVNPLVAKWLPKPAQ